MSEQGQIYDQADAFKAALLRRERAAASELVRYYGQIWEWIRKEIDALTTRYYEAVASGEAVSPAWVFQLDRLRVLQLQIERELRGFARFASPKITAEQLRAVEAATQQAERLMRQAVAMTEGRRAAMGVSFTRLPMEALSDLIGFTRKGSPLYDLLAALGPQAAESVTNELIAGLGLGLSPREVAQRVRAAFGGKLARALTVARTETLRAYREATHRAFQANSGVLSGWIWLSGHDPRTCAACWAMHGTFHTLDERLDDHPNGRCTALPVTKTYAELGLAGVPENQLQVPKGVDLFAQLTPAEQLEILGKAKFEAYQDGTLKLADLVGQRQNRLWGSMRYERSLADALGVQ